MQVYRRLLILFTLVAPPLQACIDRGECTFSETGMCFHPQYWWYVPSFLSIFRPLIIFLGIAIHAKVEGIRGAALLVLMYEIELTCYYRLQNKLGLP